MVRQWHRHLQMGTLPLPLIIPLVFYHGEAKWTVSQSSDALFGPIPPELRHLVPRFEYELLDVSLHSYLEIVGGSQVKPALSVMRSIFAPDLLDRMPEIWKSLDLTTPSGVESLETMLRYLSAGSSLDESDLSAALKTTFQNSRGDLMPTLAEKWVQQGVDQGVQLGVQQGVQQGQLSTLLRILHRKFGTLQSEIQSQLAQLSTGELYLLSDDLLDLATADDLRCWIARRGEHTSNPDN